jgi:Zn-dependent protease
MRPEELALAPLWYVTFLLSTTCHEAAHAWAAKLGGDLTAFHGGQVTLNPVPHIRREPFGLVVIPILSFLMGGAMIGWASAPYDPLWSRKYPKRAAWMSLAGPAANFTLMLLSAILIRIGLWAQVFTMPREIGFESVVLGAASVSPAWEGAATFLSILFALNLLLGTFNLLPVPPLDGYSVLGLFTTEELAVKLQEFRQQAGMFSMIGLLIGWQVFGYIFGPVFRTALHVLYSLD